MGRKPQFGKCRICGRYTKLTFEHVPPETTFNSSTAKMITGNEVIQSVAGDFYPWEINKLRGTFQQRGTGGYFLCADCNSKTGHWYVPEYDKFIHIFHNVLQQNKDNEYKAVGLTIKGIRPLPVFKQIITMFCDINDNLMGDDSLKEFLLNRDSQKFNTERYKLYAYVHSGEVGRLNGISVMATSLGTIVLSEISMYPLGFVLYLEKPDNTKPEGVEINCFCDYQYEDVVDIKIIIPVLENNILFSGDYRTKDEIINCINETSGSLLKKE